MKTKISILISVLALSLGLTSCSDVAYPDALTSQSPSSLEWNNSGRQLTLTWTLPEGAIATLLYKDNVQIAELTNGETTYTVKRADANVDNYYTVKAVYEDGRVSEGKTALVHINYDVVTKAGYLLLADDYTKLTDDDELAAAKWFNDNYVKNGTGAFIKPSDIANITVDEFSRIMIVIDRNGIARGWENLPAEVVGIVDALKAYVQDDGKLLLLNHATQLVEAIGRTKNFAPNIFGSGDGGNNPDVWGIQAVIGNIDGQIYDHRSHDLYKGLETGQFTYGHDIFPTIGAGNKEDHNCMWDLNAYSLTGNPNVVTAFETATNSSVLGTWQHVVDYCCAAVVEFNPTDDYSGRIIAIGPASYEFSQTDGNAYQSNLEKIAKNALEYLK